MNELQAITPIGQQQQEPMPWEQQMSPQQRSQQLAIANELRKNNPAIAWSMERGVNPFTNPDMAFGQSQGTA